MYSNPPAGLDNEGHTYSSIEEMWEIELCRRSKKSKKSKKSNSIFDSSLHSDSSNITSSLLSSDASEEARKKWYDGGAAYWRGEEASMSGMLGGLTQVNKVDSSASLGFLELFKIDRNRALDCGAGIGRVTEHVLGKIFKKVDLLEQNGKYLEKAKELLSGKDFAGDFLDSGLQSFVFGDRMYDCIWIQWVLPHLTDDDLVLFLIRCKDALTATGIIVAKENNSREGFYLDKDDFSITRSDDHFKKLFADAGLTVAKVETQYGFPKQLYPVKMYALRR